MDSVIHNSRQQHEIFFILYEEFEAALQPTQPPVQLVPGVLSLGAKRPRREADHSPPPSH
jgi:hypothetical protein